VIRALHLADLECAVRVLRLVPVSQRAAVLEDLLARAATGARHYAMTGRAHPACGNGTLMSVLLRDKIGARPAVWGRDDLLCLAQIAARIAQKLPPEADKDN
jgi:hypothetical protein